MKIETTEIPGLLVITSPVFRDERGFFNELHHQGKLAEAGFHETFVQDNLSRSTQGVLRGLHYQVVQPQGKLVRVLSGSVFDVAVDLRRSSPAFGRWVGFDLDGDSGRSVYIPVGCAHGFYVKSSSADVLYKCTSLYAPQHERTLIWNDPRVGIKWSFTSPPILSPKDAIGRSFETCDLFD
jgi:dTDP-4-dehydrorhamnose 3,5-epimerase